MNVNDKPLADPTHRIVSIFPDVDKAQAAARSVAEAGIEVGSIKLFNGREAADEIDASAKWFADTDVEIQRFKRALLSGQAVLSVGLENQKQKGAVEEIAASAGAGTTTYFGRWATESKDLDE